MTSVNIQNQKCDQIFIRLASKKEKRGGIEMHRGFCSIPELQGYDKVYKPYGKNGRGYYYSRLQEGDTNALDV